MQKLSLTILTATLLAFTFVGLGGCTATREPVTMVAPSYSYLRDVSPTVQVTSEPVEAAQAPAPKQEPVKINTTGVELMSEVKPDRPTVSSMAELPQVTDGWDFPEPVAVFVSR